jgi:hypothetical protein
METTNMKDSRKQAPDPLPGWGRLRHGGLLFDGTRLEQLSQFVPPPLDGYTEGQLRQRANAILDDSGEQARFVAFVLEGVCGLNGSTGNWTRGSGVAPAWGRRAITGENVKPRHLWKGRRGALLPVFLDDGKRLGIGRGRRVVSQVLGWLRAGGEHLALLTNGRQWRLLFAGLDYDAWCEWDLELWFDEGELTPQVTALRTLLNPELWTPESKGAPSRLLQAIRDTRKGQAELSEVLGERVREAVEMLIQAHGEPLRRATQDDAPSDRGTVSAGVTSDEIYRAACRVAMRLVVILFAESRDLLPRDNPLYHASYGLNALLDQLEREGGSLSDSFAAWPRILALFKLVRDGSHHPVLPIHAYGGELFAAGDEDGQEGVSRALAVFEQACFENQVLSDQEAREMLRRITRTTIRIRQGRAGIRTVVPVDFSDLSSEYLGILYEGLLDYELKTAPADDPVVFLSVGDQPALPLSRLEAMDDAALKSLFESLKKNKPADQDDVSEEEASDEEPDLDLAGVDAAEQESESGSDLRRSNRTRAETWARRAAQVAGLVRKRRGRDTPERRLAYEQELAEAARRLVARVVLPGEWYLVRWGGTRKGSGSFYTRPGLAVPTVQRTLRPLAYHPPVGADGKPDRSAPPASWTPRLPEEILDLTVCDPACGSGTFPLAALRFLTEALYASLQHHRRIEPDGARSLVRLLGSNEDERYQQERLADELIPCRPDDHNFEARLKAVLRRHVVERCIYAVDLDPLAVELCRLSLWIETMDRTLPFGFLDHKVKCGNSLIGAWFDQFQHYPVMAWKNREGGDKNHSNGVHFAKGARTKAIKAFVKARLKPDLKLFLHGPDLFREDMLQNASTTHDEALAVLADMHALPVQDAAERARRYREDLLGSSAWRSLKEAMDLWCSCWFWPADDLACAPLPTSIASPTAETRKVAARVAAEMRFFHWELEFPDVFREHTSGFDAMLGNPPWETLQLSSTEFFSNIDPLYRAYGKQEALRTQSRFFVDVAVERHWLDYSAQFASSSNWMKHTRDPFGDPKKSEGADRFTIVRGNDNLLLHDRWRSARSKSCGFGDPRHPFRHRGEGKAYTYKLFLESSHTLLKPAGRLGFIVPSGLYSDNGTGALRRLLLDHCQWEWLFGIENRDRIFPIHRSYKFNPVVVEKGGTTDAIRTAFMRRSLDDWERADEIATSYTRAQIERFSPRSRAILEIQSMRDLEILGKIYANSVLLGDQGPNGWGIRYAQGDFNMTSDSRLFPPRPQWEAKGYRPDEYSRWLLGDWRPIEELWEEMGIDPSKPQAAEIELEDWLFDTTAGPERRQAEAQFIHGHLLKPGDVAHTAWRNRCARRPYDQLPVPRADIHPGVILARDGDSWIREEAVKDVALPLYEGRMLGQFDYSQKGWVSGKGRGAVWREIPWASKQVEPQFLMRSADYESATHSPRSPKLTHMNIGSATNTRSAIGSYMDGMPAGHSAPTLHLDRVDHCVCLTAVFNSFTFDFVTRLRVTGLHLDYHVLEQNPLPRMSESVSSIVSMARKLCLTAQRFAPRSLELTGGKVEQAALAEPERSRLWAALDALIAILFGLDFTDLSRILRHCDRSANSPSRSDPKGFWRVDKNVEPELRQTVLTLAAFRDVEAKIEAAGYNRELGIEAFLTQNDGEGWMLPETLCLADLGLGDDDRARRPQVVAQRLGSRFYDWQVAQGADEALREWHLHARNLLGADGYACLIAGLVESWGVRGEAGSGLLSDPHTCRLLGHSGQVTALVEIRARRLMEDDAYWTVAAALRHGGHPATDQYGALLDQLHARGLLDDAGYRHRSGRKTRGAEDRSQLQVAESGSVYQAATHDADQQGELFE